MFKQLMLTTALTALIAGGAVAQSANPSAPQGSAQMQNQGTTGAGGSAQFVSTQSTNQFLSSNFEGTDVIGAKDEKIGDVNDILFDRNGQIVAYVVGVGGFLGIGEKNVALAPSSFQVVQGENANDYRLRLSMTKEQLQQAQAFETQADKDATARRTTTGSGAAGTAPRPANPPASTNR